MMNAEPQKEHKWLQKLVGDWTYEGECVMGADQPPMKNTGSHSTRSLGGLWIMGEGTGETPDGQPATSMITLGFDPQKKRFVGTFVASMMTYLWTYDGALDASGKKLVLDAEGPSFGGNGMAKYQDMVEIVNDDHWILSSQMLGDDGKWTKFMTAHYRRKK